MSDNIFVAELPYPIITHFMSHEFAGGCPHCGYGTNDVVQAVGHCTFCAGTGDLRYNEFEAVEKGGTQYKREAGADYPASDYAYTPDKNKPSTWKLRLTSTPGGKPDRRIVGMAVAALGKGFRGNKVEIPAKDLPAVKRKVRGAWRDANPGDDDKMPEVLKAAAFDAGHDFSTVQLVLDHETAEDICEKAAKLIDADDVHPEKGMEARPHITVRYGLATDDPAPLIDLLKNSGPIEAVIHGCELFEPEGTDYDVLVLRVTGDRLATLWKEIGGLAPGVTTYPEYKGHITLGYVKKGFAQKYADLKTGMEGDRLTFTSIEFNARDDVATTIPLLAGVALGLEALAMAMPEQDPTKPLHPNRIPFEGVLTRVDEASTRPPNGSRGHRVLIPRDVAETHLDSLIGMGVGVDASFRAHRPNAKVGVITEAWIDGRDLKVRGHLYGKDFPREVEAIQARSRAGGLGMSYEVTNVEVDNPNAAVWALRSLTFTGAAILYRNSAAYAKTQLAASHDDAGEILSMTTQMQDKKEQLKELLAQIDAFEAEANAEDALEGMSDDMVYKAMKKLVGMGDKGMSAMKKMCAMDRAGCMKAMKQYAGDDQTAEGDEDNAPEENAPEPVAATTEGDSKTQEAMATLAAQMTQLAEELKSLKAANGLLTDVVRTQGSLLTDGTTKPGGGGLLTDQGVSGKPENGGPDRKTMTATGDDYENAVGKDGGDNVTANYPKTLSDLGFQAGRDYTEAEIGKILDDAGMDMSVNENFRRERMEIKAMLMQQGQY